MSNKNYFTSPVGRKLVMGGTGLFLILFLVVHCYANFQIFLPDGRERFNVVAHFLGTNLVTRILEIGLFAFFILHIVQGLSLEISNRAKRPVKYAVMPGNKNTKWYVRSMGLLGTLILLFLIIHLAHFWGPNRFHQAFEGGELDLYDRMQTTFQSGVVVIIYVLGCISLGWHLAHGFWSAFHSLGLSSWKYKPLIKTTGFAFAIIIPLAFIAMPLAFYFNCVGSIQAIFGFLS